MTIKEVLFRPPLKNITQFEIFNLIEASEGVVLPAGTFDVTPEGYRDKYIVEVVDPGNGDNIGEVKIQRRGGKAISTIVADGLKSSFDQSYRETKSVHLRPGSLSVILARPDVLDDPQGTGLSIHGVIYYEKKLH